MSSWSVFGGPHEIAGFSRVDRGAGVERIEAIVVQRVLPSSSVRSTGWRAAVHALLSGPKLQLAAMAFSSLPDGWSGSVGAPGPRQVLYSDQRALVRVRGREFALPRGDETLILLVDEMALDVAAEIETHVVCAPATPVFVRDQPIGSDEYRRRRIEWQRSTDDVRRAWLDDEPAVRAFLARPR